MKIICIGRNYAAHSAELEKMLDRRVDVPADPVWFLKPETALLTGNAPFRLPTFSREIHYECELVVRLCRDGKDIPREEAGNWYGEVGLGIDFTARDLQRRAAAEGNPWEPGKAFDHSAAVSPLFLPLAALQKGVQELDFSLCINGVCRQEGHSADMIFGLDHILSSVSRYITLCRGDLVFTGTPVGAGPVCAGDRLEGWLEGRKLLDFEVLG